LPIFILLPDDHYNPVQLKVFIDEIFAPDMTKEEFKFGRKMDEILRLAREIEYLTRPSKDSEDSD